MTSFLDIASKQCELDLHRIGHICESAMDTFNIRITDLVGQPKYMSEHFDLDDSMFESVCTSVYESESNSVMDKIKAAIDKIIETLVEFIGKVTDKIKKVFNKDFEDKLDAVKKSDYDKKAKVTIVDIFKKKKLLDEYIKELLVLERKLMNIKFEASHNVDIVTNKTAKYIIAVNEVNRELDALNDKYDKKFLEDNADIIKMASEDAIRFADKDLKNVKIDYDAIENDSKKILKQFKTDADGCEVPVKMNTIQKMANSLATRVRMYVKKKSEYQHKNTFAVLAVVGVTVGGVAAVALVKHKDAVKEIYNKSKESAEKHTKEILDITEDITSDKN